MSLEVLVPTTVVVALSIGETISILPYRWGQFCEVARLIKPIKFSDGEVDLLALVADHGDAVSRLIEIATDKPSSWVATLQLDDALNLAAAILESNRDFFSQRLAPQMSAMAKRLSAGAR